MQKVAGVKFRNWSKIYTFANQDFDLKAKDPVIVETEAGFGFGRVVIANDTLKPGIDKENLKKIVRIATEEDLMQVERNREKEQEALNYCRDKIEALALPMKLVDVDYIFDGSKAVFRFNSENRVDFRALVKDLAGKFHTRIEMRQIGVRDQAKIKGGIGACGRMLCCSTWIKNFEPVSVKMAKKQGLSLNPSNISGMCGRLMCCLTYEYKNYVDGEMDEKPCGGCEAKKGKSETPPTETKPSGPQAKPADAPPSKSRPGSRAGAKAKSAPAASPAPQAQKTAADSTGDTEKKEGPKRKRRFRKRKRKGPKKNEQK